MSVEVISVKTPKQFRDFFRLPFLLHRHDPNWVPPLQLQMKNLFSPKNPFAQHASMQSWIAYRNKKPVGRLTGIINEKHNQFYTDKMGFWGFFDCENSNETAAVLFAEMESWVKNHGMRAIQGPMNPSINHECGLQISAFDTRPYIMMTQNPEYYLHLVEHQGYTKAKDLHAWLIKANSSNIPAKMSQKIQVLEQKNAIRIRTLNMKNYTAEIDLIFKIYNDAWEKNWGFVPMSLDECRHMAKELKSIVLPQLIYILEVDGEPAAFSIWLPDMNQVMVNIRNGKLFPSGLVKFLWHTKVKKTIDQGRVLALGVSRKFQHLPLGAMLYFRYLEEAPKFGFKFAECSWILEDNEPMQAGLKLINAWPYKTYRIYEKGL